MRRSCFLQVAMLAVIMAVVGCSDSSTPPPAPGIEPEIVNIVDSFEYQVTDIDAYSGTASYTWENSGVEAAVDHSSVISKGVGTLVVRDADGVQVYAGPLSDSGSLVTDPGTAGSWTVSITYSSFSGTVNFRVQKA